MCHNCRVAMNWALTFTHEAINFLLFPMWWTIYFHLFWCLTSNLHGQLTVPSALPIYIHFRYEQHDLPSAPEIWDWEFTEISWNVLIKNLTCFRQRGFFDLTLKLTYLCFCRSSLIFLFFLGYSRFYFSNNSTLSQLFSSFPSHTSYSPYHELLAMLAYPASLGAFFGTH